MTDSEPNDSEALKQKLNVDTGKISWQLLAEHQQRESVVEVDPGLDLVEVACEFVRDNRDQVEEWLNAGLVAKVDDKKAEQWQQENREVWAVVVAPWVLVQQPG
ncbi:MAG: DUF2288 family protein [Pseudohongiellaceae bacterium]|jgi:hypothetical protein